MLVVTILMECFDLITEPMQALRWLSTVAAVDGLGLALLGVNERGRTRLAKILLVSGLLVIVTVSAATGGGIHAPAATLYISRWFSWAACCWASGWARSLRPALLRLRPGAGGGGKVGTVAAQSGPP